jgi:signal transduction histidine kinase
LLGKKKDNIKTHKQKKSMKEILNSIHRSIKSIHLWLFIVLMMFSIIPMFGMRWMIDYFYQQEFISDEVATVQTKAAAIAGEFNGYNTLAEAKAAGIYEQMVKFSNINSLRIRIVNTEFIIEMDSYSIETGKNVINSSVISTFNNRKSYSETNRNNGTIEAVSPITINGSIIGVVIVDTDISEAVSFKDEIYAKINIVVIGIVALIFTFAYIIAKIFGRSFKKAFAVVADIANGHIEKRIEPSGSTELKDFAECFNVIMDKASAQDESRQEFVSNVSHELRTPITSIKVLADSLNMQDDVPVELYKEFMQDITKEIDRESKIIEDLLSIVRMDKAVSTLNITSVNVNELLEMVLTRLKPIAEKKNIEILFESFRPVVAEIDEVKFSQVISNLVDNAIKYNNIDGWVHVSLNADYQYFYIRVEDSGIGIPQESQDMVFERFYRVDKARSRQTGGTGLGLSIVKKIILMHHGTIKLHSEEGSGTTFTMRIPLNYVENKE